MTGVVKGILISVVVVVLIGAIAIGLGVYWIKAHGGELMERSKQTLAEGQKFGKGTDNQGCVTETISRHKHNPGISGVLSTQLFLNACLQSSQPTPGFCDEIPEQLDFIKSAEWQRDQCARNQLTDDNYCPSIFQTVQKFCEKRSTTK